MVPTGHREEERTHRVNAVEIGGPGPHPSLPSSSLKSQDQDGSA